MLYKEVEEIIWDIDNFRFIKLFHDDPQTEGHCRQETLLKKLRIQCRWKGMTHDVGRCFRTCDKC